MYIQPSTFSLDDFVKSRGATDLELEIMKIYFELDPQIRKAAIDQFKSKLSAAFKENPALFVPDNPEDLEKICPPIKDSDEHSNVG